MKVAILVSALLSLLLLANGEENSGSLSKLTYTRWINLLRYTHKTLQREPPATHDIHFNRTEHVELIATSIVRHFFNDIFTPIITDRGFEGRIDRFPVDFLIMLDSSASIGTDNFDKAIRMLTAWVDILDEEDFTNDKLRVSMISYSEPDKVVHEFEFSSGLDKAGVISRINSTEYHEDGKVDELEYDISQNSSGLSVLGSTYLFFVSDTNHDGDITTEEMENGFDIVDLNGNGAWDLNEFRAAWKNILYQLGEASDADATFKYLFDWADENKDHSLTSDEMNKFITTVDFDNSTTLSEVEFELFWTPVLVNKERAVALFHILDTDANGEFDKKEQEALVEYFHSENNDELISTTEFQYGMLKLYAKVFQNLDAQVWTEKLGQPLMNPNSIFG